MKFEDFRALFHGGVKAMLDWDALARLAPPVEEVVLADREPVGDLFTVWHAAPDGSPGDWRDTDSFPQTVAQAAGSPRSWPSARAAKLTDLRRGFSTSAEPLVLLAPAYSVNGRMLILDVSHRVVAGYLSGVPMRVLVLRVEGPIDPAILPDLRRWVVR